MKSFEPKSLTVFGRLPDLSLAELESLYGAEHIKPLKNAALLDLETDQISFKRLGGTVKLAKVLALLPMTNWTDIEKFLLENIPKHLQYVPEGSFTLGISLYGFDASVTVINRGLMNIKKSIRKSGRSFRVVPNKTPELNSAQVLHNKLTTKGAWELLLVRDGRRTILAQTIFVQDIEAYGARDQARPKRDARVGMLPPKLAQTMLNIAIGSMKNGTVLDPFCGTGVILQEALLAGYDVIGTDKDERMVEFSRDNLKWLQSVYPNLGGEASVEQADATNHKWPEFDAVASETYLGRPFSKFPNMEAISQVKSDVNHILKRFLENLATQLPSGSRLCLAVPAWQKPGGSFMSLPLIDRLSDMGYNYLDFKHTERSRLIYFRQGQVVARQLLALTKA